MIGIIRKLRHHVFGTDYVMLERYQGKNCVRRAEWHEGRFFVPYYGHICALEPEGLGNFPRLVNGWLPMTPRTTAFYKQAKLRAKVEGREYEDPRAPRRETTEVLMKAISEAREQNQVPFQVESIGIASFELKDPY